MERVNDNAIENLAQDGKQAAKQAARSPWVERVMRLGFAVRGILYGVVGLLAAQVAFGSQGQLTDQQGAIAAIGSQPFGRILLIVMLIGLAGYALWGFVRAFLDPLRKGKDTRGLIERAGFLASGISYAALLLPTARFLFNQPGGAAGGASADSQQQAVSTILTTPWGPWLVGAAGVVIAVAGIAQIITGWKAKFDMRFDPYSLNADQRRWATRLGRFGYIARGLVFSLIGSFLVQAAMTDDPQKVRGVDGALRELALQPYGTVILGIVAVGLMAFGAYSLLGGAWFHFKKA